MAAKLPMRNPLSLFQKRLLSAKSSSATNPLPDSSPLRSTVEFLVNSCGLTVQSALSVSQKLRLDEKNMLKAQLLLQFLKAHDFKETHIVKLVEKQPQLLKGGIPGNFKPKFEFLVANGFAGKLLPELIASNPSILGRSLDSHIKPCFQFFKSTLGCHDNIAAAAKRSALFLSYDWKGIIQPNIELLIKEGVPEDGVAKLIICQPRVICRKQDRIAQAVDAAKNLGFEPKAPMFLHAIRAILSISELTWKKKIEVMKSFGWTEKEILQALRRYPILVTYSEEKLRSVVDILLNTFKMDKQTILSNPKILMYSIDKRLRPRYDVLKILESKELIAGVKKIHRLLLISEKDFLDAYVTKYADKVPGLFEVYMGATKIES